jgi:ribonuclease HII
VDEAGRGAWAGPVVAAAVVLPPDPAIAGRLAGVADSKQLSPRQREYLLIAILAEAASSSTGIVSAGEIDAVGIAEATRRAMHAAIRTLAMAPDFLLVDYVRLPSLAIDQHALPKGDSRVVSIAAASIVAKVTRDRLMDELARQYPGYGFERHKGYGTAGHRSALQRLGPCAIHRRSFQPVQGWQMALFAGSQPATGGSNCSAVIPAEAGIHPVVPNRWQTMKSARQTLGQMGERLAAEHLATQGMQLVARNWRYGRSGEIDLVMQDGPCLVVVEVRTRRGAAFGTPEESVTPTKQVRLAALAEAYCTVENWQGPVRIDVVAIALAPDGRLQEIRHYRDAVW